MALNQDLSLSISTASNPGRDQRKAWRHGDNPLRAGQIRGAPVDGNGAFGGSGSTHGAQSLLGNFRRVRRQSLELTAGLSAEDQQVQSMNDVSPTKWHLAHTTWFFETFLLKPHLDGYQPLDERYEYLFNSYYEAVGPRHARAARGLLTRPSLSEIHAYRAHVDAAMERLLDRSADRMHPLVTLGLNHEEQHQELILMDIKHVLSLNPLRPAYAAPSAAQPVPATPTAWLDFGGGLVEIGATGAGFSFDNEGPRHKVWLEPFRLADRLVTSGDWLEFMADGGYRRPELWLSDGWATVNAEDWDAPLYWRQDGDDWRVFTLEGERLVAPEEAVCHVSFYEADAFARWRGCRLPTEAEWEVAVADKPQRQHDLALHPRPSNGAGWQQASGALWQWTASAYAPYPGYRAADGALGEYNGKFMSGQMVLRGGACVTPPGHARHTYRNFFPPAARWAFSGVRLANDV
jgi:ergothioneine biosynthesis protein EgtB